MDNFDEAKQATEQMFEAPVEETPTEEAPPVETPPETPTETPVEENPPEAVQVAQEVTQLAEEQNAQLSRFMAENEQLKAHLEQLQKTVADMSKAKEEEIIEEAMAMPTIDFNDLAFADEETQARAQEEYASKMAEYVRKGVMDEMSPYIEEAKAGRMEREKNEAISTLSQVPELAGIEQMMPQINHIISKNKWLQSEDMPVDERIINAYMIAKGVNATNTPEAKEPTDEELMALYDSHPSFQEAIEKKRIDSLKNNQQVPPFSASSGAVNVALNIKEKPKSWDEASERTKTMFGR